MDSQDGEGGIHGSKGARKARSVLSDHVVPRAVPRALSSATRAERARLVFGTVQLMLPRELCALVWVGPSHRRERTLVQVEGARRVLQSVTLGTGSTSVRADGAVVEAIHAASMVVLALVSRRYRRFALTSTAFAVGFAAASRLVLLSRGATNRH